ncbi:MAG TPA: hypothetical protein VFD57_01425 [Clostridia bacterium]|nr:hypothetical protein [Clostridia bacterium]
MKIKLALVSTIVLVLTLLAGSTMAWFTDTADPVVNEFKFATEFERNKVEVEEPSSEELPDVEAEEPSSEELPDTEAEEQDESIDVSSEFLEEESIDETHTLESEGEGVETTESE